MRPRVVMHVTTVPMSLGFIRGQAAFMREHGIELLAVSSDGPEREPFARTEAVSVHVVEMARRIAPLQDLRALAKLVRHMRMVRPDVVDAHTPKGGLLGMIAATLNGVRARVYHMRGLPYETAGGVQRILLTTTERISCALAHVVLCVSPSLRAVAIRDKLLPETKAHVLGFGSGNGVDAKLRFDPTGVEPKMREIQRNDLAISQEAFHVLFLGRIVRDKGILDLAAAWSFVAERVPHARLTIVGDVEARDPVPPSVLNAMRDNPTVRLLTAVSDPVPLYASSDLVVLPTYREGFPNVLLEAAAMERPAVATRVTGCVDAIMDGVTGRLVQPGDPIGLADAIIYYATNPSVGIAHGRAARQRVLRDFNPDRLWAELLTTYEEAMTQ